MSSHHLTFLRRVVVVLVLVLAAVVLVLCVRHLLVDFDFRRLCSDYLKVEIDTLLSRTFADIPIRLVPPDTAQLFKANPSSVQITISGGAAIMHEFSKKDIEILLDRNRFEIENKNALAPVVKFQKNIHSYLIKPELIEIQGGSQ